MSRLIDADKLLKLLDDDMEITSKFVNKSIKDNNENDYLQFKSQYNTLKCYRAIVEDMPIAYDVDKVVEHIEKGNRTIEESMKEPIDEVQTFMYKIQLYTANNIIDVIKGGGIDGKKRS